MFASRIERRFYQIFFRLNHVTTFSNHAARNPRRLLSSSAARRSHRDDIATLSDEPRISSEEVVDIPAIGDSQEKLSEAEGQLWEPARLRSTIRNMFRSVAHPVAIVTALDESNDGGNSTDVSYGDLSNDREQEIKKLRAMTVSSLNTVSLDPTPVISFNVRTPSSTWDAIRTQGRFRVTLLKATERATQLATMFAKGDSSEGYRALLSQGVEVYLSRPGGRLRLLAETVEWESNVNNVDPNPAPYIRSNSVAGCILADVLPEKCVQVNDHVIVVAEVNEVRGVTGEMTQADDIARSPTLSYFNHHYVRVDRPLMAETAWEKRSLAVLTAPRGPHGYRKSLDEERKELDAQGRFRKVLTDGHTGGLGTVRKESTDNHGEGKHDGDVWWRNEFS
ncbi:putative oxidoreductase [Diplodia corticola]|uniref:Putative oxidoreductase n=1 Tax=Diplodia corticola TaxID=236234 RepID=A0A1J9S287_9PEZI|nr:putative oxidoreductase [Diplodia corticola]OJD34687.1 putative oxidoreductase [Diplodia corticola]